MACLDDRDNCLSAIVAAKPEASTIQTTTLKLADWETFSISSSDSWEIRVLQLETLLLRISPWNAEMRTLDMLDSDAFQREHFELLLVEVIMAPWQSRQKVDFFT